MFLSGVTSTSNPAASACASNSPLLKVSHPWALATLIVWPTSKRASPRGVPWSKSTSILGGVHGVPVQAACDKLQHCVDLFAGDVELFHYFLDRHAVFKVLEHDGNRHASPSENPRPAHPAGYAFHGGTL